MGIRRFIHRKIFGHELTPKGECVKKYIEDLLNGSENHIAAYDEVIYATQESLRERFGFDVSFEETLELMSTYFSEYY